MYSVRYGRLCLNYKNGLKNLRVIKKSVDSQIMSTLDKHDCHLISMASLEMQCVYYNGKQWAYYC